MNAFELMSDWRSSGDGVLRVWDHPDHGTFVDGLFKMHDQEGFSLADSLMECRKRGWKPCLRQFVADALAAGWSRERAEREVQNAKADSGWEE